MQALARHETNIPLQRFNVGHLAISKSDTDNGQSELHLDLGKTRGRQETT